MPSIELLYLASLETYQLLTHRGSGGLLVWLQEHRAESREET